MLTRTAIENLLEKHGGSISPKDALEHLSISRITCDPAKVRQDTTFFYVPGETRGSDRPVEDAIASGANCLVSECLQNHLSIPQIVVGDAREAFAEFSAALFDHPSRRLRLIGVTGTNGKTTVTHLIDFIFRQGARRSGLIGTLGYKGPDHCELQYFDHTTPPAAELEEMLAEMAAADCGYVALEVTSHGLVFRRVGGSEFAVAVLTNVTQDHLDFHKTMEHYWQSKRRLFESLNTSSQSNKTAIVNLDDRLAGEFLSVCDSSIQKVTYGFSKSADINVVDTKWERGRQQVLLNTPSGRMEFSMRLPGRFNVQNAMAAIAVCLHEGINQETISAAIENFAGVPGRFEVIRSNRTRAPLCIVDFAHTPDALEKVLQTICEFKPEGGKLFCVFGCAGERDQTKRPIMGEIAERLADRLIITADNPGFEDPQTIIGQILHGVKDKNKVMVEPDRGRAIRQAIVEAGERDIILFAGKGHEHYQLVRDQQIPFSDRTEVAAALAHAEPD